MSGVELADSLVMTARQKEPDWVHGIRIYDKVPRRQATDNNIKPLTVHWVGGNKGDDDNMNMRPSVVGRALNAKTKEALFSTLVG